MALISDFTDLYRELGLYSENHHELPLHRVCSHAQSCWDHAKGRKPPEDKGWSSISRPWVGPKYNELRLVVIGENFNEYGGLDALVELSEEAKDLIAEGWRRIRFSNSFDEYPGSLLWHRIGCYAAAFGEACGAAQPQWDQDGYPKATDASLAYDLIAFVEHVKCSPVGDKSHPTGAMWEHCGSHILKRELQLLAPDHVLILGTSNNAWGMREKVYDSGWKKEVRFGSVTKAIGTIGGKSVTAWVVPHPTSRGDSAGENIKTLREALRV